MRMLLYMPPSPRYDQVRDVLLAGLLLAGSVESYNQDEDALVVMYEGGGRRRLPIPFPRRRRDTLAPVIEGRVVRYGRGDRRIYSRLYIDSGLAYNEPLAREGLLVAIDWRHLLYHPLEDISSTLHSLLEALRDTPSPEGLDARLAGHAYALIAAARLRGIDKDIRIILDDGEGVLDSGVIPSSTYKLLRFVDEECLEELEGIGLDALNGDYESLEYLTQATENRDSYALRHMLKRMGCRVKADELIAPADILG